MSVIAEFTVPADSLALSKTLEDAPEMIVEIERVVAHEDGRVMPYFWVRGGEFTTFDNAIKDDPTTKDVEKLDDYDGTTLYRAEWTDNVDSIVYAYLETGATIIEATGRNDQWELRMRFDDEGAVTTFKSYCEENGIPFHLRRLYHPSDPKGGGQYGLTPRQREILVTALEQGYYTVPRTKSMQELANEVDISHQSLSQVLRRGHQNLISNTLTVTPPKDGDAT